MRFASSFDQFSISWLLLSSIIGGGVGVMVTFLFQDVLRPALSARRDARRILRTFTNPLLRSAERLETRINILVRNADQGWYANDEYFRLSTLFIFAEYLGWVHNIEQEFGFVQVESERRDREFTRRFTGFFRAMSSFAYFHDHPDPEAVSASEIPRLICTAVGEMMAVVDDHRRLMGFTDFVDACGSGPAFTRWFDDVDRVLRRVGPDDPLVWDRLIAAGAQLRALCAFLDPKGTVVRTRPMANLGLLANPAIRSQLSVELGHLPGVA